MKVKAIVIPLRALVRDMPTYMDAKQIIIEDDRGWCIGDKVWYEGEKSKILSLKSDKYEDRAMINIQSRGLVSVRCSDLYRRYGFFELRKTARELKKELEKGEE